VWEGRAFDTGVGRNERPEGLAGTGHGGWERFEHR
jgi:hypothetical protein